MGRPKTPQNGPFFQERGWGVARGPNRRKPRYLAGLRRNGPKIGVRIDRECVSLMCDRVLHPVLCRRGPKVVEI
jgi:hypothetical protein